MRKSPVGDWVRFFLVEPKSCFHAGDFVARAIASICRRPASLDLGLAFRWPISRARRQMRGDRIKRLGLRTDRTSCNTYLTLLSRWRFRWHGARSTRAALGAWRPSGAVDGRRGIGGRGRLFSVPRRGRRGYFARRARSDVQRRGDAGPS